MNDNVAPETLRSQAAAFPELMNLMVSLEPGLAPCLDGLPPRVPGEGRSKYPIVVAWMSAAAAVLFATFTLPRLMAFRSGFDAVPLASTLPTVWAPISILLAIGVTVATTRPNWPRLTAQTGSVLVAALTCAEIYGTYSLWVASA